MNMTTARLKYNISCIFKFVNIEFYGENEYALSNKWHKILQYKYNESITQIDLYEAEIQRLRTKTKELFKKIKSLKRWYRPWKTKEEKEIWKEIYSLNCKIDETERKLNEFKDNSFYNYTAIYIEAKYFLKENGFILKQSSCNNDNTTTEIWEGQCG